jgi:hypothetical protein
LLYNENPGLVRFLISEFLRRHAMGEKKVINREAAIVRREMQEELEKLEATEDDSKRD